MAELKPHNLQLYSNAYVVVEGALLTQQAAVTLEKKNNSTQIHTLGMGFAGLSLGSGLIEVTIETAVPSTDFEFNPDFFLRTGSAIEIGVVMASRQTLVKGFITDATYTHAVNDASKLSIKLLCRLGDFT